MRKEKISNEGLKEEKEEIVNKEENSNNKENNENKTSLILKHKLNKKLLISLVVIGIVLLVIFEVLDTQTNTAVLDTNINIEDEKDENVKDDESLISNDENTNLDVPENGDELVIKDESFYTQSRDVYSDYESYLGTKITLTGFIYNIDNVKTISRMYNDSDGSTYPVGLMYEYEGRENLQNDDWVKATGILQRRQDQNGYYPVLKLISVEKVEAGQRAINN